MPKDGPPTRPSRGSPSSRPLVLYVQHLEGGVVDGVRERAAVLTFGGCFHILKFAKQPGYCVHHIQGGVQKWRLGLRMPLVDMAPLLCRHRTLLTGVAIVAMLVVAVFLLCTFLCIGSLSRQSVA